VKEGHEVVVVSSIYSKSDLTAMKFIEDQYFDGVKVKVVNVRVDNKQPIYKRIYTFLAYAHCCPKRFSSITNFIDFTGFKRCKNAFCDFDPSFI
jgi:hypothetical protein